MSHDPQNAHSAENKTVISFKNSFWLVVIIVGLFVAALNFIQAESGSEEGTVSTKEQPEMKTGANAAAEKPANTTEQAKPAEAAGKDSSEKEPTNQ